MRIAFHGSSLLSAVWNGAATYYRGVIRALHARGHRVAFFEPRAFGRQERADIDPPGWCEVVVWEPDAPGLRAVAARAAEFDAVIKCSGVGVLDAEIQEAVWSAARPGALRLYWDVDAPATLAGLEADPSDPLRAWLPRLDLVLTYGGGDPVIGRYRALGAQDCVPVYNALDPETHHPAAPEPRFAAGLAFLGNRLPDREARVEEFFLRPAAMLPGRDFLLGGSGWEGKDLPGNVRLLGHVSTREHNAFNCTPLAVLNVSRESMAANGHSPATRVFEVAGAGACLITDAWEGLDAFLAPGREVLVARDGAEVAEALEGLTPGRAARIGAAARSRTLRDHTYERRAAEVEARLEAALAGRAVA
ncbi:spore maturation protein CgeB [Hasllibacter halocynthiae]|uniref:Spore maturation protein CgeB n=1 Tax=Hasllibacter halocynthiae TaxID=595589 RepID=A0A2T0X9C4_9RHOB|nr:glycosyltransferase [Hasllibacter halocynthiae]PRY95464.1 spore maturation protein CgeB [Hasllibacter halocynthiae]